MVAPCSAPLWPPLPKRRGLVAGLARRLHVGPVFGRSAGGCGARCHRLARRRTAAMPALLGKRLLVVDDNDTNRRLIVRHATGWGMPVTDASSGLNALEALEREGPFVAGVLDLMMPEMDGFELAIEPAQAPGERLPAAAALLGRARDPQRPALPARALRRPPAEAAQAGRAAGGVIG